VSREEKRTLPISVVALRAEGYSADDAEVVISLRTKYSAAERRYSVPLECFRDLLLDLQRLEAITQSAPDKADKAERLPDTPKGAG
jgi:hypothetical protein